MSTSGTNLQQVQHVPSSKPVTTEFAVSSANEAILAKRAAVPTPPIVDGASHAVHSFSAPPPLLKQRSSVKRSYTSLIAMTPPSESLLPPSSETLSPVLTPSPVVDQVINDTKAVADLCSVLKADHGVLMSNPDAPSLARSTLYSDKKVTAQDVISAIDNFWTAQLPSMELLDQ
jgi:hypothetical protein